MKQMAASAATRNVSRSFRSMAGGRLATELDACRKLPPKLPPIGCDYRGKFRREESGARGANQNRVFHPADPGKAAVSESQQIGRTRDDEGSFEVIHALHRPYPFSGHCAFSACGGWGRRDGRAVSDQNCGLSV